MTTYATAEAARQRAIEALRTAELTVAADRLAALPPIVNRKSARAAYTAAHAAADIAIAAADRAYDIYHYHGAADRAAGAACEAAARAARAARAAASDAASADGAA